MYLVIRRKKRENLSNFTTRAPSANIFFQGQFFSKIKIRVILKRGRDLLSNLSVTFPNYTVQEILAIMYLLMQKNYMLSKIQQEKSMLNISKHVYKLGLYSDSDVAR